MAGRRSSAYLGETTSGSKVEEKLEQVALYLHLLVQPQSKLQKAQLTAGPRIILGKAQAARVGDEPVQFSPINRHFQNASSLLRAGCALQITIMSTKRFVVNQLYYVLHITASTFVDMTSKVQK